MTVRRAEIERSLAQRGRPAIWANEQEAAALSGITPDQFRRKVRDWERRGFPKVNHENGKRSIPAILAFWNIPHFASTEAVGHAEINDDDGQENWGGREQGQRRAS